MTPDVWLKKTPIIKVRNRLPTWTREDFLRFAELHFQTTDLNNAQLADFVERLRVPGVEKAPRSIQLGAGAPAVVGAATVDDRGFDPADLVFVPVKDHTGHGQTHWYRAGKRAELRFGSPREAAGWVLERLALDTGRLGWSRCLIAWQEANQLDRFDPARASAPLDAVLAKVLSRRGQQRARQLTPLPDNATLAKRYWGAEPGDRFRHPDGHELVVTLAQPQLDGPPTLHFQKVPA